MSTEIEEAPCIHPGWTCGVSMTDYYQRSTTTYLDGTPIFKTVEDERSESYVARELGAKWKCEFRSFGKLSPVDWFAIRDGRMVAVAELKTRGHSYTQYPTVFLNFRKWSALVLMACGSGVPAFFVVRFTNGIYFVKVAEIDASKILVGGCRQIVKSRNDIEPVIEVPVSQLKAI